MPEQPTVLLRFDASSEIGMGHAARCLALAHALRERGARVSVLSHELTDHFEHAFSEIGCTVVGLLSRDDPAEVVAEASRTRDSDEPITVLVDQYGLDAAWETEVRRAVSRLVALEDRPFRHHDADVLVDPGADDERLVHYSTLVPERTQIVAGRDYVIIHPRYAELRSAFPVRGSATRRVLVQLGSDRSDLVLRVLTALDRIASDDLRAYVVLPSDHPHLEAAGALCAGRGWALHSEVRDIWNLYAAVDLAIAAPGVSVWERMCLGVPSAVIGTTELHRDAYPDMRQSGAVTWLGHVTELEDDLLGRGIQQEIERTDLQARSEACREAVDGRGASRLASLMTVDASSHLALRPAAAADESRTLRWANDRDTRRWSFTKRRIPAADYREWFTRRLSDHDGCRMHVLIDEWQSEMGIVRLERNGDGVWQMSATLAPGCRNRGLAEPLVRLACAQQLDEFGPDLTIEAKVRLIRPGAGQALARAGFRRLEGDARGTAATFRRVFGGEDSNPSNVTVTG